MNEILIVRGQEWWLIVTKSEYNKDTFESQISVFMAPQLKNNSACCKKKEFFIQSPLDADWLKRLNKSRLDE